MIFEFESKDGERIEREYRIGCAPTRITRKSDRKTFKRVPSMPAAPVIGERVAGRDVSFVSDQFPMNARKYHHRFAQDGRAIFNSAHEAREACRRAQADGIQIQYNDGLDSWSKRASEVKHVIDTGPG